MVIDVGEPRHPEADAVVAAAQDWAGPRYVCLLGVSVHGDEAFVSLAWDPRAPYEPPEDIYGDQEEVELVREGDVWVGGSGTNGGGTTMRSMGHGLMRVTFCDWAPPNVRAVELRFLGQTYLVPVRDGAFMFAAWEVPDLLADGRRLTWDVMDPDVVRWIRDNEP